MYNMRKSTGETERVVWVMEIVFSVPIFLLALFRLLLLHFVVLREL